MFSLLQIILSFNFAQPPTVNILSHFDNLKICEIKLDQIFRRNIDGGNNAKILVDNESNKFLKIE